MKYHTAFLWLAFASGVMFLSSCARQDTHPSYYPETYVIGPAVRAASPYSGSCQVVDWGNPHVVGPERDSFEVDIIVKATNKYGHLQLQKLHLVRVGNHWTISSEDRDPINPDFVKIKEP